jgi:hypothetical protein
VVSAYFHYFAKINKVFEITFLCVLSYRLKAGIIEIHGTWDGFY